MYTVHAFYISLICQILTFAWIYPAVLTCCSFYAFGLEYDTPEDLFTYMLIHFLMHLGGISFGLFCGTLTENEQGALLIGNTSIILFNFGSGIMANTGGDVNPIIKFLSWVSPMHYGTELLFKEVTKGRIAEQVLLDHFGYNDSNYVCYGFLGGFSLLFLILGWINLWAQNRSH